MDSRSKRARRRAWILAAGTIVCAAPSHAQEVRPTPAAVADVVEAAVLRERPRDPTFQLSIRFTEPRTTYRAGEPIDIEARFDPALGLPTGGFVSRTCRGGWIGLDAVFDPGDAVVPAANPICTSMAGRLSQGVPGCSPYPTSVAPGRWPTYVRTFTLTEQYRFQRPGRYRVHLRLRRVSGGGLRFDESNPLTFDILPRDPAWQRQAAADAERDLFTALTIDTADGPGSGCGGGDVRGGPQDPRAMASRALARLQALGTVDAIRTLVRLLARRMEFLRTFPALVREALYAAGDVGEVVRAMQRELDDPQSPVPAIFIRDLAAIDVGRRHSTGTAAAEREYLALVEYYRARRSAVLAREPGRLEQQIRADLTSASAEWSGYLMGVVVLHDWPVETARVFRMLSAEEQRRLLARSWRQFAHLGFVPLFRELVERATNPALREVALRHWIALDPDGARAVVPRLARRAPPVRLPPVARLRAPTDGQPLVLTVYPPGEGERWPIIHIGDNRTSLTAVLAGLGRLPRGTRIAWRFALRTEFSEEWPIAESEAVFELVRSRAAVVGIEVARVDDDGPSLREPAPVARQPAKRSPDGQRHLELLSGERVDYGISIARLRVTTTGGTLVSIAPVWATEPDAGERRRLRACDRWGWIGDDRVFCEGPTDRSVLAYRVFDARTGNERSEALGDHFVWSPDRRVLASIGPAPEYEGHGPRPEWLVIDGTPIYLWPNGPRTGHFRSLPTWSAASDRLAIVEQARETGRLSVLVVMPSQALRRYRLPWVGPGAGPRLPMDVHLRWEGSLLVVDYEGQRQRITVLP